MCVEEWWYKSDNAKNIGGKYVLHYGDGDVDDD
jgi:hypothetical protein